VDYSEYHSLLENSVLVNKAEQMPIATRCGILKGPPCNLSPDTVETIRALGEEGFANTMVSPDTLSSWSKILLIVTQPRVFGAMVRYAPCAARP
jgi:hypothetical protein